MKPKELRVLLGFLDYLQDVMGNASCNDWQFPADWTQEERRQFMKDYYDYNGEPESFIEIERDYYVYGPPDYVYGPPDFAVCGMLTQRLREELDERPDRV